MNRGFKSCHPMVNILFYISVIVYGMLLKHPVCIAVSLFASFSCYLRLKGRAAVRTFCFFLLPMLIFVTLINSLFARYGVTPLLTLPGGNSLTFESMIYGLVLAISVTSVIMWMFCYNEVVTADKFMHVFGKRLPTVALVISMSLRFIPMYKERFKIIAQAQRGIGLDYKTGSFFTRIKNTGKILSILLTWALENAIETSDSMRSRGYGLKGRKTYSRFNWSSADIVLLILIILIDLLLAISIVKNSLFCQYNPHIIINPESQTAAPVSISSLNIELNRFDLFGIVSIVLFFILSILPLLIDLKEELKWNRLKSKI